MPSLTAIACFLDNYLESAVYSTEQNGIIVPTRNEINRIGLALKPWENIPAWIAEQQLDALFLHRYWQFNIQTMPAGVGLLAYHLPFDEKLTLGYNSLLAQQFGMSETAVFGRKEGRPLGMTGIIKAMSISFFQQKAENIFGGLEGVMDGKNTHVTKIAVVGAMTEQLVREAASAGVQLYVTGQLRKPATKAVQETGMHIIAVGHRRSEQWGLNQLAGILHKQWNDLEIIVAGN